MLISEGLCFYYYFIILFLSLNLLDIWIIICRSFQVGHEKFYVPWLYVINRKSSEVPLIDFHLVSDICFPLIV